MPAQFDRRSLLAAAALSPLAAACAARAPVRPAAIDTEKLAGAGALIDRLVAEGKIAGGAVRIAGAGETLYERRAGFADIDAGRAIAPDTIYRLYSMTKPVTAAAVMCLVDDGSLDLADPVARFAPEFSDLKVLVSAKDGELVTEPARAMRVIDLLVHTSGVSNSWNPGPIPALYRKEGLVSGQYIHDPDFKGLPDFAARLARVPLQFQPGTQWLYSFATDIAGHIVERISGKSFGAFLKERLFEPLGMTDTDFYVPEGKADRLASMYAIKDGALVLAEAGAASPFLKQPTVESGSAGLLTTIEDYGRFASMLAGLGAWRGVRVMSAESARVMMSSQVSETVLGDTLEKFMSVGAGGDGRGMGAALGGAVLADPSKTTRRGIKGEYGWGGAASTTFIAIPEIGVDATLMTQLFPSGTLPLRDWLKEAVYAAVA